MFNTLRRIFNRHREPSNVEAFDALDDQKRAEYINKEIAVNGYPVRVKAEVTLSDPGTSKKIGTKWRYFDAQLFVCHDGMGEYVVEGVAPLDTMPAGPDGVVYFINSTDKVCPTASWKPRRTAIFRRDEDFESIYSAMRIKLQKSNL